MATGVIRKNVLDVLSLKTLKRLCRERELRVSGRADELRARLAHSYRGDVAELADDLLRKELVDVLQALELEATNGTMGSLRGVTRASADELRKAARIVLTKDFTTRTETPLGSDSAISVHWEREEPKPRNKGRSKKKRRRSEGDATRARAPELPGLAPSRETEEPAELAEADAASEAGEEISIHDGPPTPRTILSGLSKARLADIAREHGVSLTSSQTKEQQVALLLERAQVQLSVLLRLLGREELRSTCRAHGLEATGRARRALASRILEAAGLDPEQALPAPRAAGVPGAAPLSSFVGIGPLFEQDDGRRIFPRIGDIVQVRHRQYLVEDIVRPPAGREATRVSLVCLDDDNQGRRLYRVQEHDGAGLWQVAAEYQVLDDPAYIAMGTMDMNTHLTGDNYDLHATGEKTMHPTGEWNTGGSALKGTASRTGSTAGSPSSSRCTRRNGRRSWRRASSASRSTTPGHRPGRSACRTTARRSGSRNMKIRPLGAGG